LTGDGQDPRQVLSSQLKALFLYLFHIKTARYLTSAKARG
jgi:hypothetical protein